MFFKIGVLKNSARKTPELEPLFLKASWSNSLIYLKKLTSIYIFKLGISHVLIGAAEIIHVSTIKLPYSLLFLLV